MARTTKTLRISSIGDIPSTETIRKIPREKKLRLVFEGAMKEQREAVGQALKKDLDGFLVGVHMIEPEINIAKLMTEQEVERHQDFFEACAKDYRNLATELIFALAKKLNVHIALNDPLSTFAGCKQTGSMDEWRYFFHGLHCSFKNQETGQCIQVPLAFGHEFGDLTPSFFIRFIESTERYQPLPIEIYESNYDGEQINQKMLALGKFERIAAAMPNHFGIVVVDRVKN